MLIDFNCAGPASVDAGGAQRPLDRDPAPLHHTPANLTTGPHSRRGRRLLRGLRPAHQDCQDQEYHHQDYHN